MTSCRKPLALTLNPNLNPNSHPNPNPNPTPHPNSNLDLLQEAQSALKVYASVSHNADGSPADPAVVVPLPVPGLSSRRVLVMDLIPGTPLNKLAGEMEKRGIKPGSPESKLAGKRILTQLTEVT